MHDPNTGKMIPMDSEQMEKFVEAKKRYPNTNLEESTGALTSYGKPIPFGAAVFSVDEKLMIKGAHFVVESITEDGIVLKGVGKKHHKTADKRNRILVGEVD